MHGCYGVGSESENFLALAPGTSADHSTAPVTARPEIKQLAPPESRTKRSTKQELSHSIKQESLDSYQPRTELPSSIHLRDTIYTLSSTYPTRPHRKSTAVELDRRRPTCISNFFQLGQPVNREIHTNQPSTARGVCLTASLPSKIVLAPPDIFKYLVDLTKPNCNVANDRYSR